VFAEKGILLDAVLIREIEFDKKYVSAIEDKQIEAVKIETAKNQAEAAKFDKERTITNAEASAEEQRLQQATLGREVLRKLALDKWNGILPTTLITGEGGQFIIPLPENANVTE